MESVLMLQGRVIGAAQLQQVRQMIESHPEWSRYRLSRELCLLWGWRAPNGQLKDMAARTLLLKLEQRGHLSLPAKRQPSPNRMLHKQVRPVAHACEAIQDPLVQLTPVEVIELSQRPDELPLYEWFLREYHYLSYASPVGLNLKYLVRDRKRRPLSCLLFGSAAWKCAPRDQFIGWSPAARQAHLQQVTNNTRFLLLPWVQVPHLASHVLSLALRRQVKELRARLARNSTNSHQPPSSDGLAKAAPKPKSLRTKSGRRPGGQVGHPGRTLQPVARPDHVRVHKLGCCPCGACRGRSLAQEPVLGHEKRQVFERPQKPLEVTKHQAEIKCGPVSGRRVTAAFPDGITAPAQYGPRFKAQMVYFNDEHLIPYQRLTRICEDLYGQPLSEATVAAANQRA